MNRAWSISVVMILMILGLSGCPAPSGATYTVTYNGNGSTGGTPPIDPAEYIQGEWVVVLGAGSLVRASYSFAGWTTSTTGAGASYGPSADFVMGTSSVTLYAVWIPDTLTFYTFPTSIEITGYITAPTGSMTISWGVTSLGDNAFMNCTGLTGVSIPSSVTSIGASTFAQCTGLTSVAIPSSVTSIGASAFAQCTGLTSVTIPNSVTAISDSMFDHCSSLTSITIPSSITAIGLMPLLRCDALMTVHCNPIIPPIVSWYPLDGCPLLSCVTVPAGSVTAYKNAPYWAAYSSLYQPQ